MELEFSNEKTTDYLDTFGVKKINFIKAVFEKGYDVGPSIHLKVTFTNYDGSISKKPLYITSNNPLSNKSTNTYEINEPMLNPFPNSTIDTVVNVVCNSTEPYKFDLEMDLK